MRLLLLFIMLIALHAAPDPPKAPDWHSLEYLLGNWTGEGSGDPGQGTGAFSFQPDLQKRVVVRKNHAAYPAAKDRPALTHDDLMIVYQDAPDSALRAIYFDNEGHVIRYAVECSPDAGRWVFLSDAEANAPRYRLTYTRVDHGRLKILFEIAPPAHPEKFAPYIEAAARRSD